MPKFQYAGLTADGSSTKGVVTADHPNDARLMLADQGLYGLTLKPRPSFLKMELTKKDKDTWTFTYREKKLNSNLSSSTFKLNYPRPAPGTLRFAVSYLFQLVDGHVGTLVVTTLVASWIPARRAASVDPAVTLTAD